MNRSVTLKIIYDTDEATKQGIINVVAESSGAIREVILVSTKQSEENNKYCVGWIPSEDKTFDSDIVTDDTYDAFSEIEKETE